jgi:diguanylate cyclase (GGDEF)-like protein
MTEQVSVLPATASRIPLHFTYGDATSRSLTAQSPVDGRFAHALFVDSLTGVYNRAYATGRAQQLLKSARAARVAMLVVNVDGFSRINDIADYDLGDRLLRSVAQRLARALATNDLLARIGGDEFLIVTEHHGHMPMLAAFAQQMLALFAEPFVIAGREYRVSASVGVARSNDGARDASLLMRDAGAAMRRAKVHHPATCAFSRAI